MKRKRVIVVVVLEMFDTGIPDPGVLNEIYSRIIYELTVLREIPTPRLDLIQCSIDTLFLHTQCSQKEKKPQTLKDWPDVDVHR
jgi:hypothetical protein